LAKPIKEAVNIPVFVAGRIVTPQDAEAVLGSGSADFVSIGRGLYADPHWVKKATGEINAPIRECIACNVCFERLTIEKDVSCVQNPMVGTEFEALPHAEPQLFPAPDSGRRKVLVIGAGVAGLEAARIAAGRGHSVEIWEKASRPGGQIHLAVVGPDKSEVWPVWDYRWQAVQALSVPVRLNTFVDEQKIREFAPDFVIIATGSKPQPAPVDISRLDHKIVRLHAWDVFENSDVIESGSSVTIIGAGMVGLEVADLLRLKNCKIRLLERQAQAASGMARNNKFELLERLSDSGVELLTNCKIESISGQMIRTSINDQRHDLEVIDYLVFANGPVPDLDVLPVVQATGIAFERIGDSNKPGDFLTAIRDGWMVALRLDQNY